MESPTAPSTSRGVDTFPGGDGGEITGCSTLTIRDAVGDDWRSVLIVRGHGPVEMSPWFEVLPSESAVS